MKPAEFVNETSVPPTVMDSNGLISNWLSGSM
jgi:hypothetical protein